MTNFAEMTSKELVAAFNAMATELDTNLVKRFASRAAGIKRCEKLAAEIEAAKPVEDKKTKAPSLSRSAAIAKSWTVPETAAKRSQRNAVRVDGNEYRSVRQAFEMLDLPMEKRIKFRMELKAAGTLNAYGFAWEIL